MEPINKKNKIIKKNIPAIKERDLIPFSESNIAPWTSARVSVFTFKTAAK